MMTRIDNQGLTSVSTDLEGKVYVSPNPEGTGLVSPDHEGTGSVSHDPSSTGPVSPDPKGTSPSCLTLGTRALSCPTGTHTASNHYGSEGMTLGSNF